MTIETGSTTSFHDAIEELLARVESHRVETDIEREAIYRLRYRCYRREGAVEAIAAERVTDRFDDLPNSQIFAIYVDGQLASSVRVSLADTTSDDIPAKAVFPDIIQRFFAAGRTVLDPTRFVIDSEQARLHPKLMYVTLRLVWLATEHHLVDDTLATVRTEHQAFYRRFYGHELIAPARIYPGLLKPISLMNLDFAKARERVLKRYPFLKSSADERWRLMGGGTPWSETIMAENNGPSCRALAF